MNLSPHFVQRTKDWWKPKAGNILAILYISAFHFQLKADVFFVSLLPAICTIFGIGLTTYWVNDWVDLPTDRLLNKKNLLINLSALQKFFFLIFAVFCSLIPWLFLPNSIVTWYLLGLEFIFVLTYSLPPFRLKTKGITGVVVDALYAHALPTVLAFFTFSLLNQNVVFGLNTTLFLLFFWQLFAGLYNISIHQLEDYSNDLKSQTKTWAVKIGKRRIKLVMLYVFWPLMTVCFIGFLSTLEDVGWLISILAGFYVIFQITSLFLEKKPKLFFNTPFTEDLQRINLHYHKFLPFIALGILVWKDQNYAILLGFHIVFFSFQSLVSLWFIGKKMIHTYVIQPIYYHWIHFFKRSDSLQKSNLFGNEEIVVSSPLTIAVMNRNKDKYTETFVQLRIEALKKAGYTVHFLYGNDLPTESEQKGTLLSNYATIRYLRQWLYAFMDRPQRELHEMALRNYLLNNNIQLVFAEFGTLGVEVAPICKSLNIPYVITFYGYDFHHENTFRSNKKNYIEALNGATGIIGVSQEICDLLKPYLKVPERVVYFPCLINTKLFLPIVRNPISLRFLSIGRFAETKAPHLTILAFSEVVKALPEAKLIMIGKDGGGELFEACVILAKALGICHAIEFKGICSPEEIANIMGSTAVFVQHSLTTPLHGDKEGTPVAVMEAMAAGIPIVATRHAGIQELITHKKNGLLVDEYDWQAMAADMICLASDSQLSDQLGEKARNRILNDDRIANGESNFLKYVSEIRTKILKDEAY